MSVDRHRSRFSTFKQSPALEPYTPSGYISREDYEGPGSTITWGSWTDRARDFDDIPITLFPYASGSDYSGGTVEQSNYQVLSEDAHVAGRSVLISGGHGSFGIAYIGAPTRRIAAIVASLEAYPVLDESHMSEMETEIEAKQWEDWGRDSFKRTIERFMLIRLTPKPPVFSMGDMSKTTQTIYRKCACGETAHDCKWDIMRKAFVWACRNCGTLANDRRGQVREYRPDYLGVAS